MIITPKRRGQQRSLSVRVHQPVQTFSQQRFGEIYLSQTANVANTEVSRSFTRSQVHLCFSPVTENRLDNWGGVQLTRKWQ